MNKELGKRKIELRINDLKPRRKGMSSLPNSSFLIPPSNHRGFTLLYSVLVVGILLTVGLAMLDISVRQLILSASARESKQALYAADSGVECALFYDLKPLGGSVFATSTAGSIVCNNQAITIGSQTVPTNPSTPSRIGGGGSANPISIFLLDFGLGTPPLPYCVIVTVEKKMDTSDPTNPYVKTVIESRGYNTCDMSNRKRVERAIRVQY